MNSYGLQLVRAFQPSGAADGFEAIGVEASAALVDRSLDVGAVVVGAVAQVVRAHPQPETFDAVEFRRVRRQRQERDVGGHLQRAAAVVAGVVPDQDRVPVLAQHPGEVQEQVVHHRRVHLVGDDAQSLAGQGVDRGAGVRPLVVGLLDGGGTRAPGGPDRRQRALLADAGLVLEPDLDLLAGVRGPDGLHKRGAPSSQAFMASGLFFTCRGRGRRGSSPSLCMRL